MKVSSIQMSTIEGDKGATIDKAAALIASCKDSDLILLPEIWNIGFMNFGGYKSQAEGQNGPTLSMIRDMACATTSFIHSGSFVERIGDEFYNSCYLVGPKGELLSNYKKIHLFSFRSAEGDILSAGKDITVVHTELGSFGLATCFDLRFPELFRKMVDVGAEFFLVCSAWPQVRLEHWRMFNRVRALENQSCVLSCNAVGVSQDTLLAGNSMVVSPRGEVLQSGGDEDEILQYEIDRGEVEQARDEFPALASRTHWL